MRLQTFQESWIPIIKQGGFRRFALYDLESDPRQKKDVSRQRPEVTARLKEKLLELYQDVLSDAPGLSAYRTPYVPPPAQPAGTKPAQANTSKPAPKDADLDKLLKKIEATDLPKGYHGSTHQAYVDQRMTKLTPQQRQRIGRLWKDKRRLHPNMKNVGGSFVKIMEFVAAGKNAKASNGKKP